MITFKSFVTVQFCFTLIYFITANAKYANEFNSIAADEANSFSTQNNDTSLRHIRTKRSVQQNPACDCGENSINCTINNDKKVCTCKLLYYDFGGECIDCKCGVGSKGCKLENRNKICDCDSTISYKQFGDRCKFCDCGNNSKSCDFIDGRKVCKCEEGYAPGNYGFCTQMCNVTHKCVHGGTCLQDICLCLPGTKGPLCQTVTDCESESPNSLECEKNSNAACKYDSTKAKAYCECSRPDMKFDDFNKSCKECDCGRCGLENCHDSWISCDFIAGEKSCLCKPGFSFNPKNSGCSPCDCGSDSEACKFNNDGLKTCICKDRYLQKESYCSKCDCGSRGLCKFERKIEDMMLPMKRCVCELGFEEYEGKCKECDCGRNGKCVFDKYGKKAECECHHAFAEHFGKCQFCFCGPHANCSFKAGKQLCECPLGYENINDFCEVTVEKIENSGWKIAFGIVTAVFLAFMGFVALRIFINKRRNQIT